MLDLIRIIIGVLLILFISLIIVLTIRYFYIKINTRFVVEYHSNGKVKLCGKTIFNRRVKIWRVYHESGVLISEFYYSPFGKLNRRRDKVINKNVIIYTIQKGDLDFEFLPIEFQSDKEIVLETVKKDGSKLWRMKDFQNDKDVVLAAVKSNGRALQFASIHLKNDKEVVLESVKSNGTSIEYASESLKDDKEIAVEALKNTLWAFRELSNNMQEDDDVRLAYTLIRNQEEKENSNQTRRYILGGWISENFRSFFDFWKHQGR